MIGVLGRRELEQGVVSLRSRSGEQVTVSVDELAGRVGALQGTMPESDLNQPRRMSERPIFVG